MRQAWPLTCALAASMVTAGDTSSPAPPEIGARVVKLLRVDGALFKDLNKNGHARRLRGLAPARRRARRRPRRPDDSSRRRPG